MNMFDEDDKRIEAILKADIYEPDSYTKTIANALNKKNKKIFISIPKIIATIIAAAMFISGVAYAKQIGEFIRRIFNENKGTDIAVEYGYITDINKEFYTDSEIKAEIKEILMDEYNINLVLNIKFNDNFKEGNLLMIPDMIITDESHNILFCSDKITFDKYCYKNGLILDYHEFSEKYTNSTIYRNQTYNKSQVSLNIKSTDPYPKSKKIRMDFCNILITNDDGTSNKIEGTWSIEIDLTELLQKRESSKYDITETNGLIISDFRFETYNTGTVFEFNTQLTPFITDDMSEEEKIKRKQEFAIWGLDPNHKCIYEIAIQNENGDIFLSSNATFDDENKEILYDGKIHYKNTFDLTQYNMTDTLTLYFTIHTINEDKDVVIKLQKVQ